MRILPQFISARLRALKSKVKDKRRRSFSHASQPSDLGADGYSRAPAHTFSGTPRRSMCEALARPGACTSEPLFPPPFPARLIDQTRRVFAAYTAQLRTPALNPLPSAQRTSSMVDAEYLARVVRRRQTIVDALSKVCAAERNQFAFCFALCAARQLPHEAAETSVTDTISALRQASANFARKQQQYTRFAQTMQRREGSRADAQDDGAHATDNSDETPPIGLTGNMTLLLLAHWEEVTAYLKPGPRDAIFEAAQQCAEPQCAIMLREPWAVV